VHAYSECGVALGRMQKFLLLETDFAGDGYGSGNRGGEKNPQIPALSSTNTSSDSDVRGNVDPSIALQLTGVYASWTNNDNHNDNDNSNESLLVTNTDDSHVISDDSHSNMEYVLESIDMTIKVGQLHVLVGPVGCGKSSLLMALLGELKLKAGRMIINGPSPDSRGNPGNIRSTFAYCAQEPWILSSTLKNNILFGLPMDPEWYQVRIRANLSP
jgi:ABC-type multidrug transport system fused ATPase/permease subunit